MRPSSQNALIWEIGLEFGTEEINHLVKGCRILVTIQMREAVVIVSRPQPSSRVTNSTLGSKLIILILIPLWARR